MDKQSNLEGRINKTVKGTSTSGKTTLAIWAAILTGVGMCSYTLGEYGQQSHSVSVTEHEEFTAVEITRKLGIPQIFIQPADSVLQRRDRSLYRRGEFLNTLDPCQRQEWEKILNYQSLF